MRSAIAVESALTSFFPTKFADLFCAAFEVTISLTSLVFVPVWLAFVIALNTHGLSHSDNLGKVVALIVANFIKFDLPDF